jgi:PAS domain S-box-containing protein
MSYPLPPEEALGGEYLPIGLYRSSLSGKILAANAAFVEMLGYDGEDELLALNVLDVYVDPEDRRELLEKLVQRGVVRGFEVQLRRRDGRTIWAELHLATTGPAGAAVRIEGAALDITQRKLAESALWESDQRLELVVNQVPAVLWSTDQDLRFTLSVGAGLAGLGLRPNEVVGTTLYEFFGTEDKDDKQIAAHLAALGGETVRFDTTWANRSFQVRVEPLRDQEGQIVGTTGVAEDVSDVKRAQDSYQSLVERVRVVVWRGNPETLEFTFVAPQAAELLGYPAEHWVEQSSFWVEHLHPQDRDRIVRACRAATREARSHEMEYRLRAKDGRWVWVRDMVDPVVENGRVVENVGVLIDISVPRRAERLRRALLKVSQRAHEVGDLPSLCAALHEIVGEHMPARNFYIALHDEATGELSFPYFRDEKDPTVPSGPAGRGLTAWVLRHGEPLLATPEEFRRLEQAGEVESVGAASVDWLGVPLVSREQVVGVLAVQSYSEDVRFGPEERDLLVFISDHVARAIERERSRADIDQTASMLRSILEATADGILVVDVVGKVVTYNQRFADLWRIPQQLLDQGDDDELLAFVLDQLEEPEAFLQKVRELYARPEAVSEDVLLFGDGRRVARHSRPQLLDGKPVGRVWSFREISDAPSS